MPTDVSPERAAPVSPAPGAVGLIGLGEIGQVHASAVRRSPAARLVAVADIVPELLAPFRAEGVRGYLNVSELIADPQVGTVCVCLPHHLHFPVAMAAIRAGRHVLVEKAPGDQPRRGPAARRDRHRVSHAVPRVRPGPAAGPQERHVPGRG